MCRSKTSPYLTCLTTPTPLNPSLIVTLAAANCIRHTLPWLHRTLKRVGGDQSHSKKGKHPGGRVTVQRAVETGHLVE